MGADYRTLAVYIQHIGVNRGERKERHALAPLRVFAQHKSKWGRRLIKLKHQQLTERVQVTHTN